MSSCSPQRQVFGEESPTREHGWRESPAAETPTSAADAPDKTLALRRPSGHSQEPTKQLCGYLHKQSQKGPLKVWKTRWFVFDDSNCCLFYSNHKNEPAQGKIDISSATLTYDVENLSKHQFEIMSDGKVTSIQASSNEVMIYWLTTLQKKRRKFSAKRKKAIMENTSNGLNVGGSHGGLISGEATPLNEEEEECLDEESLPMPSDLEDRNAYEANAARKSWIPKLRPPSFVGGGGWSPNFQRKAQQTATIGQFTIIENSPELPSAGNDVSPDNSLAPQEVPSPPQQQQQPQPHPQQPPLRSHRISGRNITNRLSLLMNKTRPAKPEGCPNCTKAQETITHLETELAVKEREVKDRDEINEFLRKEIRLGDMREKVKQEFVEGGGQGKEKKVDVLLQREQTIQELQNLLETACLARDTATTELERAHVQLKEANEQVDLMTQMIKAKDHVVVELTNQVFQLENKGQVPTDPQLAMMPQSLEQELAKTKEALEAYKTQNQFLSSEIVELNAIRSDENEALRVSNSKIHDLEAKLCKIESKYFILLKEAQEPSLVGGEPTSKQELVSQMLQEALEADGGEGEGDGEGAKKRSNSYDGYGFSQKWVGTEKEYVTSPLEARVRKLDNQARTAQSVLDESNASRKAKWENYMATFGSGGLHRSEELKQLIRKHGIPQDSRTKVWRWIILDTLGEEYKQGKYQELLDENDSKTSLAINQIELDLLRTLPTNKYYDSPDSQGIHKLRNVLQAFSWYDHAVGYCQGLNRLAAIALLFLEEEDAFWCLVAIVQHLLPQDYYSRTLLGSQTDQRVLKDLLQFRVPKLSQHLSLCEIDFSLITFNWFHTIYVDNLPVETMLRIWDTFLYEGSKVLFRFALAIFKYNEESIMQQMTSIGIFNHLRTMCQNSTDVERLVNLGFREKNLSKKWIEQKRAFYRQQIKAELDHLETQRAAPTPPRTHRLTRGGGGGGGEEGSGQSPDLISFGSKEDIQLTEDEGEKGVHADSANEGEDPPVVDTPL